MNIHLILETIAKFFRKRKISDPWDVYIKTLESLDIEIFSKVFSSEMEIEYIQSLYPNIYLYTKNLKLIIWYMKNGQVKNMNASVSNYSLSSFFINDFKYLNTEKSLSEFRETVIEFINLIKGGQHEMKQLSDKTLSIQKNIQSVVDRLVEIEVILSK